MVQWWIGLDANFGINLRRILTILQKNEKKRESLDVHSDSVRLIHGPTSAGLHDNQHKDTQNNDIKHNDTQNNDMKHKDIQHNNK